MFKNVLKKEVKDAFSDSRTLFLTVFLPIIIMTGLVFFYENLVDGQDEEQTYSVAVSSTVSSEEKALLAASPAIDLLVVNDVKTAIEEGEATAGVIFGDRFIERLQNNESSTVEIIGDSFSQNSASAMRVTTDILEKYEQQIVVNRLEAEQVDVEVIKPIAISQTEISRENTGLNLIAMLIPLILSISISVGAGPAAADLFAGEKERKTMEALLMTPVNRLTLLFAKWLTIAMIGTLTGIVTLFVVGIEIYFFTENLKSALSYDVGVAPLILIAILLTAVYAMFTASILMLTSIIGNSVKEASSYSAPVMMISVFPLMLLLNTGVNELQLYHYVTPFINLFSVLKEICLGVIDLTNIALMIGSNMVYIAILLIICRILFMKDKWVTSTN